MFRNVFFNSEEKNIFKRCYDSNKEERNKWLWRNIFFPIMIICIPFIFLPISTSNNFDVHSILFHGSFTLIGINILFGMSSLLIKKDSINSNELKDKMTELKDKLNIYTIILIILSTTAYVFQVIKPTSIDWYYLILIYTLFFIILLFSSNLGLKIYMIKDEFFIVAFADEINDNVKNLSEDVNDII